MASKKYDRWDSSCWVRRGPRFQCDGPIDTACEFFPRQLVPYADRLEQRLGRPALSRVLLERLYQYLRFTELLELKSINQVGHQIALGELTVPVSSDLRSRAFLLVRDEAHHATVSDDLARQIEQTTGVEALPAGEPHFLVRLRQTAETCSPEFRPLLDTAFATISETLISGSLAQIPKDPSVVAVVRDYATAHELDEARHAAYFSELFGVWWPQLPARARAEIGPRLPDLCFAFLAPDEPSHVQSLEAAGLTPREAREWVREAFPAAQLGPSLRRPLQVSLSLFERTGVFEDPRTADAFAQCGLR